MHPFASVVDMVMIQIVDWFQDNRRDLPWREPAAGPWGVLVSEIMLQQTPVARVLPVYGYWLARWPSPSHLAKESLAEVLAAWNRMGYPRRAQRLRETAIALVRDHGGQVPQELEALLALPGVGDYTARAIRCFAFGLVEPVVDTNVRRVVARSVEGQGEAGPPRTLRDRDRVAALLDLLEGDSNKTAAAAGLMELGALICQARVPRCGECPIASLCQWRMRGFPAYDGPRAAKQPRFEGSDRQARGIFLREMRSSDIPISGNFLLAKWHDPHQAQRALGSLLTDGLVERDPFEPESYRIAPGAQG